LGKLTKKVIQITQQINKLYRSKTLQLTKKVEKLGRICDFVLLPPSHTVMAESEDLTKRGYFVVNALRHGFDFVPKQHGSVPFCNLHFDRGITETHIEFLSSQVILGRFGTLIHVWIMTLPGNRP